MIPMKDAQRLAQEWVQAWNSHDLEAIMDHYADDVELTSPFVVQPWGETTDTIRGKDDLRAYFAQGLAAFPDLTFELIQVLRGVSSIAVYYRSVRDMLAAEVMMFDPQGKIARVMAHYNADF